MRICAAGASFARSWPSRVGPRAQQQRGKGHQHRHKKIHVRGQVQNAMPECRQNAQRRQRGLSVVAQVLGIAEEKSGFGVVIRIPAGQAAERSSRATPPRATSRAAVPPSLKPSAQCSPRQRQRNHDRRLLESAARKPQARQPRALRPRLGSAYTIPTASTRRQKCRRGPACSAQTRWDKGR
jgi:hypothetical protein